MSALLAILVMIGLVSQDEVNTISKQEVGKVIEANYGKIHEIGGQELVDNWDQDDSEDETIEGR